MPTYTSEQSVTPPSGTYEATIRAKGAPGQSGQGPQANAAGGDGHYVESTFSVSDSDTLYIRFGAGGSGGSDGGTEYGGSGGAAADVRLNGTGTGSQIILGGGGGGGGAAAYASTNNVYYGGAAGYPSGSDGEDTNSGDGGTQTSGGAGGLGGGDGSRYSGGNGTYTSDGFPFAASGGGGGGYYGGGGGGSSASSSASNGWGGGGGSSYSQNTVDAQGAWTSSPEVTITWTTADVPTAPQNLTATTDEANVEVDLSWDPPSDWGGLEGGYRVYRSTTSGSGYSQITDVGSNTTTYTDTGVSQGNTYYYVVTAYNSAGESNYSNEDSASFPVTVEETLTTVTADASVQDASIYSLATESAIEDASGITSTPDTFAESTIGATETATSADTTATETGTSTIGAQLTDADGTMHAPQSHALDFDGGDGQVRINDQPLFDMSGEFTISCKLEPSEFEDFEDQGTTDKTVFGKASSWKGSTNQEYMISVTITDNNEEVALISGSASDGTDQSAVSFNDPNPGQTYHVSLVFDTNQIIFYVDGQEVGSSATNFASVQDAGYDLTIGSDDSSGGARNFSGAIADCTLHNRALSQSEVQALEYNNVPLTGLVGWWPCDEGSGDTVFDYSGNGNDGTIQGTDHTWIAWPELREAALADEQGFISATAETLPIADLAEAIESGDVSVAADTFATDVGVATDTDVYTEAAASTTIIYIPPLPRMGLDIDDTDATLRHGEDDVYN